MVGGKNKMLSFVKVFMFLFWAMLGMGGILACSGSGTQEDAPLVTIPAPESLVVSESYDEGTSAASASVESGNVSKRIVGTQASVLTFNGESKGVVSVDQSGNATQYSVSLTNTRTGVSATADPDSTGLVYGLSVAAESGDSLDLTYFDGSNESDPLAITVPDPRTRVSVADIGAVVGVDVDPEQSRIYALGNALSTGVVSLKTFELGTFTPATLVTLGGDDPLENAQAFGCVAETDFCIVALDGTSIAVVNAVTGELIQAVDNTLGENGVFALHADTAFLTATSSGAQVAGSIFYVQIDTSSGQISSSGTITIPIAVVGGTPSNSLLSVNPDMPSVHLTREVELSGDTYVVDTVINPVTRQTRGSAILASSADGDDLISPVGVDVISSGLVASRDLLFLIQDQDVPLFRAGLSIGSNIDLDNIFQTDSVPEAVTSLSVYQNSGAETCGSQVVMSLGYSETREARLFVPQESQSDSTTSGLQVTALNTATVGLSAEIEKKVCADSQVYFLVMSERSGDMTVVAASGNN